MQPTFEQLPGMVALLLEKVEYLEQLLKEIPLFADPDSELLSIEQASEFLKLSIPTLYSKVSRAEIPFSKPGKRLYFKKPELLRWIDSEQRDKFNKSDFAANHLKVSGKLRRVLRKP